MAEITQLLERMRGGDAEARDALFSAAYEELQILARARLRNGGRNTVLETTSLVHECYLRFIGAGTLRAEDRRGFFGYASQVMRSVIVNNVRERQAERRGGGVPRLTLCTQIEAGVSSDEETLLKVHEALEVLERVDARLAQVAVMRYFGGYSDHEIGGTLEIAERTVRRDWERARLILQEAIR